MKKARAKKRSGLEQSQLTSYAMLSPWLILFIIFGLIPVLVAILLGFTNYDMLNFPKWAGFDNYIRLLLDDDVFQISLKNTLIFAVITGPIGYLLSFVVAWGINEFNRTARSILTLCFYAPSLGGNALFVWQYIFNGDSYGLLNSFLLDWGFIDSPIQWLTDTSYNFGICIIVMLWMSCGTGFLTFVAGLQSLNRELAEAGAIDGIKNRWQELFYVTLPQMKPQLLFGAVQTISSSFGCGSICAALTGNPSTDYSTHTIVLHLDDYAFVRFELGYASAIAVVLFAMMLVYWLFVNKILARWSQD
ncbi:MAG: sugar ABC transporter permease [Firmicutes bacterium]|nr:sugar ABC transporter permease [Bacillota bacterium]